VDGPNSRAQLAGEATALADRYPDPDDRPPLFDMPVGVKNISHVDELPTEAKADIPAGKIVGLESEAVSRLVNAGALVAGKTVKTEFAYFDSGPTCNPHDLQHIPGGSSSGSAAAVAAGSVVRPAAFCDIVEFKPAYARVAIDGVLAVALVARPRRSVHTGRDRRDPNSVGPHQCVAARFGHPPAAGRTRPVQGVHI